MLIKITLRSMICDAVVVEQLKIKRIKQKTNNYIFWFWRCRLKSIGFLIDKFLKSSNV